MVNVIIAGVPKTVIISKFIEFLERNIFQEKIKVSVNYARWYSHDLKKISLNMRSNDARKAIRYLNGYSYMSRRANYCLRCWKEDTEDRSDNEDLFKPPSKRSRTSPFDKQDELEVIDRKIELIRKQRLLLEEESQLLLEKKRLEMIQNIGPNDFRKLSKLEEMCESNQSVSETLVKGQYRKSPDFHGPWKIIYETMKGVINAHVDDQDRPIFIDLLRSRVKNRFAVILKDEGYLTAKEILVLYRSVHSEDTDISLVQEVLLTINQSIYPIKMTTKCDVGEENEQINSTDGVNADNEDVEKTGLNDSQNEEVLFYEDVNPDNYIKLDTNATEKGLGLEINQCTEKEINDKNIHINQLESNITDTDRESEKNETPKETHQNEFKPTETNERSQHKLLNINKETKNECEFASVNTKKEIESALDEVFDMDNDLDDWVEDEKDDQQELEAAK